MQKIVISEFMDQTAIDGLKKDFQVVYDPKLVDQPDLLRVELKTADAIIVRNRTQVRGWTVSIWTPVRQGRHMYCPPWVPIIPPLPSMSSPQF